MATLSDHSVNNDDDEYAGTDDDIPPVPQELPSIDADMETATQNPAEEGDIGAILDAHAATTGAKSTQVRAKRVVRNPQPKLDPARLSGERGLPTLMKHFEKVKFKGKGHEKEDLNLLMHRMEHWSHRLCPRMTFDEVIARIEKLGSKKPVQVCVKKIRLDIPLLDDDIMPQNVENLEDGVESGVKPVEKDDWDFDDLFADRQIAKPAATPSKPLQDDFEDLFADQPTNKIGSTPIALPQTPSTPESTSNTLTAEQLQRIEEKKNMAARRKAARMAQERAEKNRQENKTMETNESSQEKTENKLENRITEMNKNNKENLENKTTETNEKEHGSKNLKNNQKCQPDEDIIEVMEQSEKQKSTSLEDNSNKDVAIVENQRNQDNLNQDSQKPDDDIIEIIAQSQEKEPTSLKDEDVKIVDKPKNKESQQQDDDIEIMEQS